VRLPSQQTEGGIYCCCGTARKSESSRTNSKKKKLNSVAVVRKRTIPTERLSLFGEVYQTRVGFEPMIPVFEGAKTVHALDRADAVIG
jgi:hypothetical protein